VFFTRSLLMRLDWV